MGQADDGRKVDGREKLENAYRLQTPADNVAYYREFAETYDTGFAAALGYSYPADIAAIFHDVALPTDTPVADIGCGTGLVGQALGGVIDGMDISPEMLAVAGVRGCYRELYQLDLTSDLALIQNQYGAVISAGTFTHGHLGPSVLASLLDIARPSALFVIGVNSAHYQSLGFKDTLDDLRAGGQISDVVLREMPIYSGAAHEHSADRASVLIWRKGEAVARRGA
jgi:predicted TPR repeat methyltransferase